MKRIYLTLVLVFLLLPFGKAGAQGINVTQEYDVLDSLVYVPAASLDSTLVGKDIFSMLRSDVHQSQAIRSSLSSRIRSNSSRTITGYRVRIFFDNKQDARGASEAAMNRFRASYPGIMAYRSFANPFFKVTVGDFRTKSEAMQLLQRIKGSYPSAFVVKETINYPVVDKGDSYVVDTVRVIRAKRTL